MFAVFFVGWFHFWLTDLHFYFLGLWCVYCPSSGDEWLDQKWRSDGTFNHFLGVMAFNLLANCLCSQAGPFILPHDLWRHLGSVCLALNLLRCEFGRANYYTGLSFLFCQLFLARSHITPSVQAHTAKWFIFSQKKIALSHCLVFSIGIIILCSQKTCLLLCFGNICAGQITTFTVLCLVKLHSI